MVKQNLMTKISIKAIIKMADYYYDKGMAFSALRCWELIVGLEPTPYHCYRYADQLRLCGKYERSEEVFLQIEVEQIPERWQHLYYSRFGQLYADQGKFDKARVLFEKFVLLDDKSTVPFIFLASTFQGESMNDKGISILESALNKVGDIDEVCYNLANRFAIKGEFLTALNFIERCLSIDPNFPNAVNVKMDIESECKSIGLL
jgi:tetratricopeptide (TPR) repeat protein